MKSVSQIIDTISYVLIAFVAISLIVSSIMIGIITYISVLERTKEIGILRAIGASKKDISRVFIVTDEAMVKLGYVDKILYYLINNNFINLSKAFLDACDILKFISFLFNLFSPIISLTPLTQ